MELRKQLDHYVQEWNKDAYDLIRILNGPADWAQQEPFCNMKFEIDWFNGTFLSMHSFIYAMFGSPTVADIFFEEVKQQLTEMILGRISHYAEMDKQFEEMKLNAEYERVAS